MENLNDWKPIKEAAADQRIPYSPHWIWRLLTDLKRVEGQKMAGRWFVNMPSLLRYVEEMAELGTKKHGG